MIKINMDFLRQTVIGAGIRRLKDDNLVGGVIGRRGWDPGAWGEEMGVSQTRFSLTKKCMIINTHHEMFKS